MFLHDFFLKEVTCKKYLNLQTISWQPQGHLFEESSLMTSFSKRFSQFQTLYWLYGFGSASSFRWQMILAFALSLYFAGFKRFWKYEYQTGREPGWRISHARDLSLFIKVYLFLTQICICWAVSFCLPWWK